ncbi:MAG TPA: PAS domain S-box protein, partial [Spirochaetota bacterium]
DEVIIAMTEKEALEDCGYKVIMVHSGEGAIDASATVPDIDLILMDIDLGRGLSGSDAAKAILERRDIPIVFLSSHVEPEVVEKTETISSYGYVVKNSGITVLDASIKMAFKLYDSNETLKAIKNKLESTLDALPDLMFEVGSDGYCFDYHSPRNLPLLTLTDEVIGKSITDIFPPDAADVIMAAVGEAREKGMSIGKQFRMISPSGIQWFEISISPKSSPSGETHFIILNRDITGRKLADDALQESENKLKSVISNCNELICELDEQNRYTFLSDQYRDVLGFAPEELIGKNAYELMHPDDIDTATAKHDKAKLEQGSSVDVWRIKNKEGTYRPFECHATVYISKNGKPVTVVVSHDITERAKMEIALKESENKYRQLFENMEEGFALGEIITDDAGKAIDFRLLDANNAYERHTGLKAKDIIGRTCLELVPDSDISQIDKYFRVAQTGKPLSYDFESTMFKRHFRAKVFSPSPGKFASIFEDVTDRWNKELSLIESEEKFRVIFNNDIYAISMFDAETLKFIDVNDAFVRLYGYAKEELLSDMSVNDITTDIREANLNFAKVIKDGSIFVPLRFHRKKDGTIFPVDIVCGVFSWKKKKVMFGMIHDITDRVEAEDKVKKLLAEKELVLKEVHHRIKNNMSTLSSLLSMQASAAKEQPAADILKDAAIRVQSMLVLYNKLYKSVDYIRMSVSHYLSGLVDEILSNFSRHRSVKVEKSIDEFVLNVKKVQPLGIIINELLTNIMKYAFIGRDDCVIKVSFFTRGNLAVLVIYDNGNGIPENINFANSSGFGLMLVGMLTQQLNGHIRIERDEGTRIILEFNK